MALSWDCCILCQRETKEDLRCPLRTNGNIQGASKVRHIKLCFVVLKAWVEKQYKLSNLVSLSAGLGQRRSINKQNGGLGYLVSGCPLTLFVLRKLGLFEFIFPNN